MKRTLTLIMSAVVSIIPSTAMADTNLWLTTEGAGIEISTSGHRHAPPPPPRHHHSHDRYCKKCEKQRRKEMKRHHKEMKKFHKEMKKHDKKHRH